MEIGRPNPRERTEGGGNCRGAARGAFPRGSGGNDECQTRGERDRRVLGARIETWTCGKSFHKEVRRCKRSEQGRSTPRALPWADLLLPLRDAEWGRKERRSAFFLRHPATSCDMTAKYVNPVRRCRYRGDWASKWACANNISLQTVQRGSKEPPGNRAEDGGRRRCRCKSKTWRPNSRSAEDGGRRRRQCNFDNSTGRRPVEQAQQLGDGGDDQDRQRRQVRERPAGGASGVVYEHMSVWKTPLWSGLCYVTLNQGGF